jgi:hypothetical protein
VPLLALELEAVLRAFDPEATVRRAPALMAALDSARGTLQSGVVMRAAFASGLLAIRSGDTARAGAATATLTRGPSSLHALLRAAALGEAGDARGALMALPRLPPLDEVSRHESPVADAVSRLLRAEQYGRLNQHDSAQRTLRWYEHLQTVHHGTGDPAPGEIGWAVGTLVRWRIAHVPGASSRERCSAFGAVARHWRLGMAPFSGRADSAVRARKALACAP